MYLRCHEIFLPILLKACVTAALCARKNREYVCVAVN